MYNVDTYLHAKISMLTCNMYTVCICMYIYISIHLHVFARAYSICLFASVRPYGSLYLYTYKHKFKCMWTKG